MQYEFKKINLSIAMASQKKIWFSPQNIGLISQHVVDICHQCAQCTMYMISFQNYEKLLVL